MEPDWLPSTWTRNWLAGKELKLSVLIEVENCAKEINNVITDDILNTKS